MLLQFEVPFALVGDILPVGFGFLYQDGAHFEFIHSSEEFAVLFIAVVDWESVDVGHYDSFMVVG